MKKEKTTKHLVEDRIDRVVFIATTVGFGEIVDKFYIEDEKGGRYECVTSTGLIIVKSAENEAIITMFIATVNQIIKRYGSAKKVPVHVLNVARRNEKQKLMEKSEQYRV